MAQSTSHVSPIGSDVREGARRRARASAAYRAEAERLAPFEALARLIIKHRLALGLTQQQLAERMGTSHSAVSRMESGQHPTKPETLRRLAHALELRFVMGFESGPADHPIHELVEV
jgi:ribosome-binding protein aMBF1 (putative translation factor)